MLGWGLLALAHSQARPQVTFRVKSAVGKDMWERLMALWMWWSRCRMGMLGVSPAWREGHSGTPAKGGTTPSPVRTQPSSRAAVFQQQKQSWWPARRPHCMAWRSQFLSQPLPPDCEKEALETYSEIQR